MMPLGEELYSGKAKSVFRSENPDQYILHFRDDTSAFDGKKVEKLSDKGKVNNLFNAFIMELLAEEGIPTHFIKRLSDTDSLVKKLTMIPVECVVRNYAAGSLCKRYGIEEGTAISPPTFEFFLKNDELHDPMINEYHIRSFGWATDEQVKGMQTLTFQVNTILRSLFQEAGLLLVDYKLEFGAYHGHITLGDEFTPDGCRLWDMETRKKLDKDRFRQGLGGVVEVYEEVARRLGVELG